MSMTASLKLFSTSLHLQCPFSPNTIHPNSTAQLSSRHLATTKTQPATSVTRSVRQNSSNLFNSCVHCARAVVGTSPWPNLPFVLPVHDSCRGLVALANQRNWKVCGSAAATLECRWKVKWGEKLVIQVMTGVLCLVT